MTTDLRDQLQLLGLRHTAETFADLIAIATKSRWGAQQVLEHVARIELEERARRSLERRLGRSRLGRFKVMADFDWSWPKRIDRDAVEAALRLEFLEKAQNVVLVAPQGLGKTMIAQNIAHAAVQAGHSVLFTTAAQMLLDLGAQDSARTLDLRLRHYCNRTSLLVVDEIGYVSYDDRNADLLFQVVSRRYERKSIEAAHQQADHGELHEGEVPDRELLVARGNRAGFLQRTDGALGSGLTRSPSIFCAPCCMKSRPVTIRSAACARPGSHAGSRVSRAAPFIRRAPGAV